jgi:hypothetical protein
VSQYSRYFFPTSNLTSRWSAVPSGPLTRWTYAAASHDHVIERHNAHWQFGLILRPVLVHAQASFWQALLGD